MELVSARLLERLAETVDLEVVAGDGLETLPRGVRRTRVPIPRDRTSRGSSSSTCSRRCGCRRVRRRNDLVHSCGAVAHARVDLMTMHLSHAAVIDAQGGARPPGRSGLRGVVGAWRRRRAARLERWAMRRGTDARSSPRCRAPRAGTSRRATPRCASRSSRTAWTSRGSPARPRRRRRRRRAAARSSSWRGTSSARGCRSRSAPSQATRVPAAGHRRTGTAARCASIASDSARSTAIEVLPHVASTSSASSPTPTSCCRARCTSRSGSRSSRARRRVRGRVHRHRASALSCVEDDGEGPGGFVVPLNEFRDRRRARGARRGPRDVPARWATAAAARAARFSWEEMAARTLRVLRRAGEAEAVKVLHVGLETTATRPGGLNRYLEQLVVARARRRHRRRRGRPRRRRPTASPHGPTGRSLPRPGRSMALARLAVDRAVRRARPARARGPALRRHRRRSPRSLGVAAPRAPGRPLPGAVGRRVAPRRRRPRSTSPSSVASSGASTAARRRCVTLSAAFAAVLEERYGVAPWSIEVVAPGRRPRAVLAGRPRRRAQRRSASARARGRSRCAGSCRAWVSTCCVGVGRDVAPSRRRPARDRGGRARTADAARARRVARRWRGPSGSVGRVDDDELVAWYRAADLTVVPSVALEGYGLVVLESLACGTPVVGTDAGGLAEALESTGQGPAVPRG